MSGHRSGVPAQLRHPRAVRTGITTGARSPFTRIALLCAPIGLIVSVAAADPLTPVHLRIAGTEIVCKDRSVTDGSEVYVSPDVLAAVAAEGKVNRRQDSVAVTSDVSQDHAELALARPDGKPMLALSDLARFVNGKVLWTEAMDDSGKPIPGSKGDTVYLLARVTDAHIENGALHVTTSFPVGYHSHAWSDNGDIRGFVDCMGATVDADFQAASVPMDEKRVLKLRAGQYSIDTARVVVELTNGVQLKTQDAPLNSHSEIAVDLQGTPGPPIAGAQHPQSVSPIPGSQAFTSNPNPLERHPQGKADTNPIEVHGLTFSANSDTRVQVQIAASRHVEPFVHYGRDQLLVDIPHATLKMDDTDADQQLAHPLVTGLHAMVNPDSPSGVRIAIDLSRMVGFTLNSTNGQLSLDLRLPRNATGALADKVIVVDAGHGGTSTGATGHDSSGTTYEKNITLAISLKLRAALERCGAKVVMTRDRDVNVALDDRPHLANNINADFFISVHNDSNGVPNSATGTSTYFHMHDPSGRALATCVQRAILAVSGLGGPGVRSDTFMYASGFAVLRLSKMPSILVEVAYINNANDRRHLLDEDFQERIAQAICNGLRTYIEGNPREARRPAFSGDEAPLSTDTPTGDAESRQ